MKKIISEIYSIVVKRRNRSFDANKIKIHKCVSPVISVGNLSVGGSGKTPFVITLTKIIKELGCRPAIVGRGYRRKSNGEVIVSDGNKLFVDARTGGDEMILLAETLKVPVIAHDRKYLGALSAESRFDIDCIIIDDGFQHRYLHRDLDVLLLDTEILEKPYLIPKGRLREPLESIKRADVICFVGNINPEKYKIEGFLKDKITLNIKITHGVPFYLVQGKTDDISEKKDNISTEQGLIALSGIAKPKNFRLMLEALNYSIKKDIVFSDHHIYYKNDIDYIINKCNQFKTFTVATTEKDAVKLKEFGNVFAENNIQILIFPIFVKIEKGEEELKEVLKKLLEKKK